MTVSVDITVAERAGVLIRPLAAVHDFGGEAWVLRVEGGHARHVPVRLGLRGARAAEILEGLNESVRIAARTGVRADSWIKTNAQAFTAVSAQNTSNMLISAAVALSVAFGVASVLVVSVVQRGRKIGILRAMGRGGGKSWRSF